MDKIEKIKELIKIINKHNKNYYVLDNPTISDVEWDRLYNSLLKLEEETGIVFDDSPSRRVGGEVLKGFKKYKHFSPLYSLDKCQSLDELDEFIKKTTKAVGKQKYSLEYKFDGLTIAIYYKNGKFVSAATRGNGAVGEDVTEQVRTIQCVPMNVPFKGEFVASGEAIMPFDSLEKYNLTAKDPLKNARNGVAGAIRNLDPKETAKRNLTIYFYAIPYIEDHEFNSQQEIMEFLNDNGFKTCNFYKMLDNFEDIKKEIQNIDKVKTQLGFLIDGMVLKINSVEVQKKLGYTIKFPKYCMAYKFEAQEVSTILKNVTWQVGRTGKITPIAILEPVELAGATVSRATLNNTGDIKRKKLKTNVRVFIRRSNEVIPEVLGVAEEFENSKEIISPALCPSCNSKLVTIGANLFCENNNHCQAQILQRITHYCSRDAMNIDGISSKTVLSLYSFLNVKTVADLYKIDKENLLKLDNFKDKKASNIVSSIINSKKTTLAKFIYSLGILTVGKKTSKDLAKNFKTFENFKNATSEQLININDIGGIVCENILQFFSCEQNIELINDLFEAGVEIVDQFGQKIDSVLTDKKVILTGTLEKYSRLKAQELIEKLGGVITTTVSKNTDILIYGENAGSKLLKAKGLNLNCMSEKEFYKIIDESENK